MRIRFGSMQRSFDDFESLVSFCHDDHFSFKARPISIKNSRSVRRHITARVRKCLIRDDLDHLIRLREVMAPMDGCRDSPTLYEILIWTDMPMDKVGRFLVAQNVPEK
jgi:hypothetical protein